MANGALGKAMSQAGNNVTVYTAPAGIQFATVSINLCNQGAQDSIVKIAVGVSASPGPVDYIEFGAVVPANGGILERTCICISEGERVVINGDNSLVSARVHGLEQL